MRAYEEQLGESFDHLLKEADLYFSETGKLHSTLAELARKLEQAGISYAIFGRHRSRPIWLSADDS